MNCNDIALLLDDGDTGRLEAGVRRDLEAHLALCADCARDWRLHERLVARRVAPMPAGLVEACRALVTAAVQRGRGTRARNRLLVIGTVAMAAAAAVLVAYLKGDAATPVVARADATLVPAVVAMPMDEAAGQTPAVATGIPAAIRAEAPPAAAAVPFTVRVLPLRNEATDAARAAAVESFHQAVLQQLRAIPGLTLLPETAAQGDEDPPAEYVLTVSGGDASARNEYSVAVMLDAQPVPGGGYSARMASAYSGEMNRACADPRPAALSDCRDPASLADRAVSLLRTRVFPPDPLLRQQIEARLHDPSQSPDARFQALTELAGLRQPALHQSAGPAAGVLGDSSVIQSAISLAAVSPDPRQRAEIWRAMRGVGNAALLQPLVEASRLDPDPMVRAHAAATLAADFADSPTTRAAALRSSPLPGKTPVAWSGPWQIVALPAMPRGGGTSRLHSWIRPGRLPNVSRRCSFIRALPVRRAATRGSRGRSSRKCWTENKSNLNSLLGDVAYHSGHPAVTELVLENVAQGARRMDWLMAAEGLLRRPDGDARVKEALERIAGESPDEQLRTAAEAVLRRVAAAAEAQPPPR
jgi:hypothetical protein